MASTRRASSGNTAPASRRTYPASPVHVQVQTKGGPFSQREGAQVVGMQRRRLQLAMAELLSEGGVESASVGRVCSRAGVSRRTFYELFNHREDCFMATFDHVVESVRFEVVEAYGRAGRWRERMCAVLALLLDYLEEDPALARVCVIESLRAGPQVFERRTRLLAALAEAVDEGRAESRSPVQAPPLTAQGVVGGVMAVIHTHTLGPEQAYAPLLGQLMAMIVHPYLGAAAARDELELPNPGLVRTTRRAGADPFKDLPIRFTYRTARVLATIASEPGASNRHIAGCSGISDDGQASRLLRRLSDCNLIENRKGGENAGEPNAWALTERGEAVQAAIGARTG